MKLEDLPKITIIPTGDGFVVDSEDAAMVFYNKPDDIQEMLYTILYLTGYTDSRYDKERVRINVEPGDKYENEA